ncbi:MAG: hypothetical protein BWY68_00148 [bacterium ADurb.Bin400]|nr:MAG: hypothetical protein BWY68_00148 [bacterium ADurb.Bin400]
MSKIRKIWKQLQTSFWFVPASISVGIFGLAILTLWLDHQYFEVIKSVVPWLFSGTPDAARAMLSAIAGSIATIASVVYSIAIIALQLSASQYSPRALRTFIQDRGNQAALGVYVATIIYALLILRGVRSQDDQVTSFVPQISVTVAIILAIISLGALVYFVNQVVKSLQANIVVYRIHKSLIANINQLYPEQIGKPFHEPETAKEIIDRQKVTKPTQSLCSNQAGFVRSIDQEVLKNTDTDGVAWFYVMPEIGQFIQHGQEIAQLCCQEGKAKNLKDKLHDIINVENQRTDEQDPLFPIQQLTDVAIKTTPGDPTTVSLCLDYLTDALCLLSQRKLPDNHRRFDGKGTLHIFNRPTWERFVAESFGRLRHDLTSNSHTAKRYSESLLRLVECTSYTTRIEPIINEIRQTQQMIQDQKLGTKQDKEAILNILASALSRAKSQKD